MDDKTFERFMGKVIQSDVESCWEWIGSFSTGGYGRFHIGANGQFQAARLAWEHFNESPIPDGMQVCHKCDNPACVNPYHLFIGTHQDNMQDCKSKRRGTHGERNWKTKLTEKDVVAIRRRYSRGDIAQSDLAREYGVQLPAISKVVTRHTWRHVQ